MLANIEKRVKKDIRLNNPFKKNEKVLVVKNDTKESFLTIYLLEKITKGLDLRISTEKNVQFPDMYSKIVLPLDGDDISEGFIQKPAKSQTKRDNKTISLLKTVLDKEVSECVKILGKDYEIEKHLLDNIESKYPGSKFGFLKSVKFLEGLE